MGGRAAPTVVLSLGGVEIGAWELDGTSTGGLSHIDELARVTLAARRLGWTIRLRAPDAVLVELVDLAGLTDLVAGGSVQVGGDAEDGEQAGVEEVVVPDDPVT